MFTKHHNYHAVIVLLSRVSGSVRDQLMALSFSGCFRESSVEFKNCTSPMYEEKEKHMVPFRRVRGRALFQSQQLVFFIIVIEALPERTLKCLLVLCPSLLDLLADYATIHPMLHDICNRYLLMFLKSECLCAKCYEWSAAERGHVRVTQTCRIGENSGLFLQPKDDAHIQTSRRKLIRR